MERAVSQRREKKEGEEVLRRSKCSSSSRVKEGCRVEGRGTLQQLVSIIRGGAAECTGACVFASVCVCKVEASQGEG